MANDLDMWNDIKELEEMGKQEEANDLLEIYKRVFVE